MIPHMVVMLDVLPNGPAQMTFPERDHAVHALLSVPTRSRVTFRTIVEDWKTNVMPMYKHSTQRNHRQIAEKHLVPRFGGTAISDVTRQEVQAYVAHLMKAGYAPKTIDHIHDVLSAVLRTAVKWGHLQANPAREIDLPTLRYVRPKWALTTAQAVALLDALAALEDDGWPRNPDRTPSRRALRAAVEGSRSR